MKQKVSLFLFLCLNVLFPFSGISSFPGDLLVTPDPTPVVTEAESGVAGSGISTLQDGSIRYITAKSNYTGQSGPGDSIRLITYAVNFRDTGYYQLFVRMRVGAGGMTTTVFSRPGVSEPKPLPTATTGFLSMAWRVQGLPNLLTLWKPWVKRGAKYGNG